MSAPGLGLRTAHYDAWLHGPSSSWPETSLIEVITENVAGRGGRPQMILERLASERRLAFHGLSLSLAGPGPLSRELLELWRALDRRYQPAFIGDHLCFSEVDGHRGHDLWPAPRTEDVLRTAIARVRVAQDVLGRRITVENVSAYVEWARSEMSPAEFVHRLVEEADCLLLLDVNNLAVEAHNFGHDPRAFIDAIPPARVAYLHVADYSEVELEPGKRIAFDDHCGPPRRETRALMRYALARHATPPPVVLEWDGGTPDDLEAYAASARAVLEAP